MDSEKSTTEIKFRNIPVFQNNPELHPLITTRFSHWPTQKDLNLTYQFNKYSDIIPSRFSEIIHVKQYREDRMRTTFRIEVIDSNLHLYSTWTKLPQEQEYSKRYIWFETKGSFKGEMKDDDIIILLDDRKLLFPKELKVNKLSQALSSGLPTPVALFELSEDRGLDS